MNRYLIILIFLSLLSSTACSPKSGQGVERNQQPTPLATVTDKTTIVAKKTLKPGAPISLIEPQLVVLSPNQPEQVMLRLRVAGEGRLLLNLSTTSGLQLADTPTSQTVDPVSTEISLPVQLLASANGRYYLNIAAVLEVGDNRSSRNIALAIQVGEPVVKAMKPSVQGESSQAENIISLPAQETIKP